ncbi:P-loop containing nucleoside triphosphate hydrolase protein [Mycotypha africana]|uniref:P-loop containing nucleoside triphosphate hydrolase protein n=1 Tax=Mycotypha africana TaxID=64632 RepID=UPI0023000828|nr:P-loop containing nucleoside triphosphate hydrolase protein [Mycotypha africana]KAI8968927.1 P-loop containing nucleoside triphosphate hydrolase protein [Mycotypha africana]
MKRVVNFEENEDAGGIGWEFNNEHTIKHEVKKQKKNHEGKLNAKSNRLDKQDFTKKKKEMLAFRKQLPIYSGRDAIINSLKENDTIIVMGETGSGKTTQIPQFVVEAGLASKELGAVAITQPRRVAAVNLAKRVAEETMCRLGSKVGYTVRFDDTSSPQTIIKYLTDGMLLREILSDELLLRYKVVVLDEAHERTLRTDMLFGMIKKIQKIRQEKYNAGETDVQPLKIIIMSATLDAEKFSEFFNNAKILYVSGRLYPVDTMFTTEPQSDYLDASLVSIFQIHMNNPKGDILVFLPGQEAIESLAALVNEYASQLRPHQQALMACPLFAALPPSQQQKVFDPAPENTRKVILSTNIAETSITIPGIRYVIDCGLAKLRGFNPKIGVESLLLHPISKSSAWQRTGRAGREAAGVCYRLYTENTFRELEDDTVPEIRRCNLASAVLALKASGISNVLEFDYMDRPSRSSLIRALEELYALNAIDDTGELSDLGKKMAEFPLDPSFSKVLIQSKEYGCTLEVVAIISLLSVDTIFFTPSDKREQAAEARKKFLHPDGDHLTLLNVLKSYWEVKGDVEWCKENFINSRNMRIAMEVRNQLIRFCERIDMDTNASCGAETDQILKCFLTGFFQNTALLQPDGSYKSVTGGQLVKIHPASAMFGKRVEGLMYNELVFTTKHYVRGVSAIQSSWLPLAAPKYFNNVRKNEP